MSEALIIALIEASVKYGPVVGRGFQVMFTKKDPTQEDWDNNVWNLAFAPWKDFKFPHAPESSTSTTLKPI